MITNPKKIRRFLVVEDELDLANLIRLHLQDFRADITPVDRGDLALQKALNEPWDLMILDLRLPGMDGLDVCRELRSRGMEFPIMMLAAQSIYHNEMRFNFHYCYSLGGGAL